MRQGQDLQGPQNRMVILTMGARVVIDTLYTCNSAKNEAIGTRMTYQHVQGGGRVPRQGHQQSGGSQDGACYKELFVRNMGLASDLFYLP